MRLVEQCYAPGTLTCHVTYMKSTEMLHRPLHHTTTIVLCVYLVAKYATVTAGIEGKKETEESGPPTSLNSTMSPSWNLPSPETKMARLPHCRDVTVGVSSSGLAPILRRAAECWREMPVSLQQSQTRRSGIYAFGDNRVKGMWAGVSIEPTCINVVSQRTYCDALFIRCRDTCLI